jgi:hypothetical protein
MRALAAAALIAGALLRIAIISVHVPAVDNPWRAWSYHAATRGPWNLYGPRGHTVRFADLDEPVVYPPLALDELAIVGRAHLALTGGRFENDVALTRTIKGAMVLLDGALAALLFLAVRRAGGAARAWWAAIAYWLNPAVLLTMTLGFVDVLFAIPAVAAVVAASAGRPWLTGMLFAAAIMTKPQGLFVAPAAVLALWNAGGKDGRAARLGGATAAAALTAAVIMAPVILAGHTCDMVRSVAVLAGHDAISALAFNLWWVVGYVLQATAAGANGLRAGWAIAPEVMTHAQAMARGVPYPRAAGVVLVAAAVLWALRAVIRAGDLGLHAAYAAFVVCAYFTLSAQVHENHFFLAVPLLAIAAALRRKFAPVLAALSVIWALNLYLVYGVHGEGADLSRVTRLDPTWLLAAANCVVFGWFGVILARACRETPASAAAA